MSFTEIPTIVLSEEELHDVIQYDDLFSRVHADVPAIKVRSHFLASIRAECSTC